MFEKSLYDLIRGMRAHKGNEKEYIQNCLKECRKEVRGADMDLKATALLKLIYLEMMGHDMSWASFHVLEVMSSPKFSQKRVGYLGAVQTFRADTEVLMMATNLLKKDLSSAMTPVLSLPIAGLPHLINPSLALSVLPDMLPRLSHSSPGVRKKTIVTLYRMALVYPETLRAAWPRIKDRLMDRAEDPSVTAAIVNVVCELGWRRPRDFLPLAPRLFELLVDGKNNWMAIKLIKLFATLTPLEPRLVRKLLPPLTELIRTTPAMSLLYECINGIIQGGILGSPDGGDESGREEIATLCVNKLRSMVLVDGDPNLKYVALLAFNRIVVTHPYLVSQQEDVILGCIESPDITIRVKVLDLAQAMVNADNLVLIVSQLMKQLKAATAAASQDVRAAAQNEYSDGAEDGDYVASFLPEEYRLDVINRILHMCSKSNYANIADFDWYIDVLVTLVHMVPPPRSRDDSSNTAGAATSSSPPDVSGRIGDELRNVAVKVAAMRGAAVHAAGLVLDRINLMTPSGQQLGSNAPRSVVWLVGEYAAHLAQPEDMLATLLQTLARTSSSPAILAIILQALPKVFAVIAQDGGPGAPWTAERKSLVSLTMARMLHAIEPLTKSPDLQVQDRAVEFHELLKLTAEAVAAQTVSTSDVPQSAPLLLVQALPSLFTGWELNSVAPAAQRSVAAPADLDLDEPIHPNLAQLLARPDSAELEPEDYDEFDAYYNEKPAATSLSSSTSAFSGPAIDRLGTQDEKRAGAASSYQQPDEESYLDAEVLRRRKAERTERNRDDPFYIAPADGPNRSSTPIHSILQSANGPDLDIDNIPIMTLDLGHISPAHRPTSPSSHNTAKPAVARQKLVVAADETLGGDNTPSHPSGSVPARTLRLNQPSSLLRIPAGNLAALSLEDNSSGGDGPSSLSPAPGSYADDEAEMQRAMRQVETLRLEMQRANERIHPAVGVVPQLVVSKKKKKTKAPAAGDADGDAKPKKKKKKKDGDAQTESKPKKAKNKTQTGTDEAGANTSLAAVQSPDGSGARGDDDDDEGARTAAPVTADDAVVVVRKKKKKKTKTAEIEGDLIET